MSLLLDALKKAALEKQRREQPNYSSVTATTSPVSTPEEPKKPDATTAAAFEEKLEKKFEKKPEEKLEEKSEELSQKIPEENINAAELTIAATKADLGELNSELETIATEHATRESDLENNMGDPDENLVFDINEIDPAYLQSEASQEVVPDELPRTGIVEEFVRRAHEHQAHDNDLSLSADEKMALQEVTSQPAAPELKPTLTESLAPQGQQTVSTASAVVVTPEGKPEPAPLTSERSDEKSIEDIKALLNENAKPVEAFSASSGKAALAQLLERSKKAANAARKRMMLMYAFLSVTAMLMVVFYYYLLHSDAANLIVTVPQPPAIGEEVAPEATPEAGPAATEGGVSTAEDTALAAATDADTAEATHQTPNVMPEPKPRANQLPANEMDQTGRAQVNQPQITTRKAPKPVATREVLPPAAPVKQAMVVERNPAVDEVSEAVDRGYKAYQRGDIAAANEAYLDALQQDPYQRDAMLGAAAVAVRQGRQQDALNIYQQRLARDPKDQYAQSGILALSEATDNAELESELNRLLQEYPDATHLHFLKGSLYAARQQWAAAQVSYFEAWQRDNKNPDLAFNLAVALDHLAQPKEAVRFYRQALTLVNTRPASFSVEAIQRRLQDLEGAVHEGTSHEAAIHEGPSP